jgi:hypothetical protein
MSNRTTNLLVALKWPSIVVASIVTGCAVVDYTYLVWPLLCGAVVLIAIAIVADLWQSRRARATVGIALERQPMQIEESSLRFLDVATARCAVVGSEHRSLHQDSAVVASLVSVLDHSKGIVEPGWDEVCESIVGTLARTGDSRCLPALGRVRLARGVQFRDAVDAAIAAIICKQTSSPVPPLPTVF